MQYYQTPPGKDPRLWQLAQYRASFKKHLSTYLVVNIFLWLLWYFSGGRLTGSGLPWPVWPLLGWGIGIASHYVRAYVSQAESHTEQEYEKLVNSNKNKTTI